MPTNGGQVGEVAEDGHEDETTHAEHEDRLVLPSREHAGSSLFRRCVGFHQCSVKLILEEEGGDEDGDGRGNEQLLDDTCCRDASHVPQHDGRHVADGREGAARIGCWDDERGIDDAVAMVADQFVEHHDHDDRRGHVVRMADRMNVSATTRQSSPRFDCVFSVSRTKLKPPY